MKIIKFGAEWCNPCQVMKPIVDRVFNDVQYNNIVFKDIDVDNDREDLSAKFSIRNVPTIIAVTDDDEVLGKIVGATTEIQLRAFVNAHMS